jgi:RNA polymerase sigma-70 factor (ECF subfamily)
MPFVPFVFFMVASPSDATLPPVPVTKLPDGMQTDDLELARAMKGDERAMRQLWLRHSPHIDAVVRRLCGDHDIAADIAQEVWIQIFRALPGYRGESQFGTWAHRIAVNRTLNALRKVKRLAKIETDIDEETGIIDGETDRTFLAESIEKAMTQLSPGARMVFVLHDVEGYTHDEIGKELGITSGGSKSQLFKARAKLRRLLAPLVDETIDAGRTHVAPI